jgi:HAD superfamily hydrolase (TIGR01509 family)
MSVQAVFFDLDYTLYDQSQYIRGALRNVSEAVARESLGDGRALTKSLFNVWRILGTDHSTLFDLWLERYGLLSRERVERCLAVFHDYRPGSLSLYPGVDQALQKLKIAYHLAIVTDGHPGMQRNKIEALGLGERVDSIVYSAELSRSKPDPEVFYHALRVAGVSPQAAVFVGDHPVRDILGARRAGMRAIRVMIGEFQHLPDHPEAAAHDRLRTLRGLPALLASKRTERASAVARIGRRLNKSRIRIVAPIEDRRGGTDHLGSSSCRPQVLAPEVTTSLETRAHHTGSPGGDGTWL